MSKLTSISGLRFTLATPYSEGHVVNAVEAGVLNQTLAENIGNNLRKRVSEYVAAAEEQTGAELTEAQIEKLTAKIQVEIVDPYAAEYKLEAKKPSSPRVSDPVEKEVRRLAKDALIAALMAKLSIKSSTARKILNGDDVEDMQVAPDLADKLAQRLEDLCEKGGKLWKEAEKNVKRTQDATAGIMDDLGLGVAAE